MHMSDALLSPAVGGAMWAATAAVGARCAAVVRRDPNDRRVPLMGVLGAFVFSAQMVNFTIPGTGSSGHLAGGVLLAVLLGPYAAFLVMASVLVIQALFFADGGLLALGCNIFNLGFFSSFVAFPFVYRPIAGERPSARRAALAAVTASTCALSLGALAVVLETSASGISSLPFRPFAMLVLPIHVVIGVVEGLVTASIVAAVGRARPDLLTLSESRPPIPRSLLFGIAAAAALTGGVLSWFASTRPDGLEWSVARTAGERAAAASSDAHDLLARAQRWTAVLPDYGLPGEKEAHGSAPWPAARAGTSVSGLVGSGLTLAAVLLIGVSIRRLRRR